MQPLLFAALAAGMAIPAFGMSLRYRRYLNAVKRVVVRGTDKMHPTMKGQ